MLGVIVFTAAYVVEIRCQFWVVCFRKIFVSAFPVGHGVMAGSRGWVLSSSLWTLRLVTGKWYTPRIKRRCSSYGPRVVAFSGHALWSLCSSDIQMTDLGCLPPQPGVCGHVRFWPNIPGIPWDHLFCGANLKLKLQTCQLFWKEVQYLGECRVTRGNTNYCRKLMWNYVGLCTSCRWSVYGFTAIMKPLMRLNETCILHLSSVTRTLSRS
jgi:hypothetical protein